MICCNLLLKQVRRRVAGSEPPIVRTTMAEHSQSKQPNHNPSNSTKKKKRKKTNEFEFCKVCKLNHNQGRSHRYFPNHTKSLSTFLSRFQAKFSDVTFFINNPSLLRPEHASRNRLWCVFCDSEINELGSSFACANAINHLASLDHLKNLKSFLWTYGGGTEQVDSFRISEKDLAKWEKKCESLKREATNEDCRGPLCGSLNDIHNELDWQYIDSFHKNNTHSLYSSISNDVVPLQNYTNERFQILHTETSGVSEVGSVLHEADPSLGECLAGSHISNRDVHHDGGTTDGESSSLGLQNLAQISSVTQEDVEGNVHSGAPPPWLVSTEGSHVDVELRSGIGMNNFVSLLNKPGKSKLNPKRVGAAWAERRKIELEMEKRGELVTSNYDANWLPNFGRVWQSGSRKESIKEFQVENKRSLKVESQPDKPIQLQPYISKRMRKDASG